MARVRSRVLIAARGRVHFACTGPGREPAITIMQARRVPLKHMQPDYRPVLLMIYAVEFRLRSVAYSLAEMAAVKRPQQHGESFCRHCHTSVDDVSSRPRMDVFEIPPVIPHFVPPLGRYPLPSTGAGI